MLLNRLDYWVKAICLFCHGAFLIRSDSPFCPLLFIRDDCKWNMDIFKRVFEDAD